LRGTRPPLDKPLPVKVFSLDLLEKDQVRVRCLQGLSDLVQHEAGISCIKSFMDVIGKDLETYGFHESPVQGAIRIYNPVPSKPFSLIKGLISQFEKLFAGVGGVHV